MRLGDIIKESEFYGICGKDGLDSVIEKITYDSRLVKSGDCFVCIKGYESDGHDYIPQAYKNGSGVFVVDQKDRFDEISSLYSNVTAVLVRDSREMLSIMADRFYGSPSKKMTVIGVTGTNGKTSVSTYIYDALMKSGIPTGLIGTIETRLNGEVIKSVRTTPESLELQMLFKRMEEMGVRHVVMEVSSHALKLCRVRDVDFDIAVFTNLTQDHLDFHKSMEAYAEAKYELMAKAKRIAVVNNDDRIGRKYIDSLIKKGADVLSYSLLGHGDLVAKPDEEGNVTVSCSAEGYEIKIDALGRFEIYNKMAAIAVLKVLGFEPVELQAVVDNIKGAEGRFQKIEGYENTGIEVIVDYAHTPDALSNVVEAIKEFKTGDLITVFGCGGERDSSKRPIMGKIASLASGHVVITDDNPRRENPSLIIREIESGISSGNYEVDRDRKSAIRKAIFMAKPGDVVLIAGKGHEKVQIIGNESIEHDDSVVAKEALEEVAWKKLM